MKIWKARDNDARMLLGRASNEPFSEMKKNPKLKVLSTDQMFRISYLLGIFKAINALQDQKLARTLSNVESFPDAEGDSTSESQCSCGSRQTQVFLETR